MKPSWATGAQEGPRCKLDVDECAEENGGEDCGAHDDAPAEAQPLAETPEPPCK